MTRKLRTIAQFGIRDPEAADSQITEVAEPRSAIGSVRGIGSSLKNVETITEHPNRHRPQQDFAPIPIGVSEMPAPYESSIVESPPFSPVEEDRDETPTEIRNDFVDDAELYLDTPQNPPQNPYDYSHQPEPPEHAFNFSSQTHGNPLALNPSPITSAPQSHYSLDSNPTLPQPLETSRPQFPPRQQSQEYSAGRGGLGVVNPAATGDDEDEWPQEAIMHMNLGSGVGQGQVGGYGSGGNRGDGYGHAL